MIYSGIKRILLLEDSLDVQILIKGNLFNNGIFASIACCDNKEQYLYYLNKFQPDIILLDYLVSSLNFGDVLTLTRTIHQSVPIIYLNGIIDKELAFENFIKGADAIVTKDSLEELSIVVQKVWLKMLLTTEVNNLLKLSIVKRLDSLNIELNSLTHNAQVFIKN